MRVKVESLRKSFGSTPVVDNVTFTVEEGELVTLLGPSGCGKTTVLRMVAGLERPSGGRIWVGDRLFSDEKSFVPPHQRGIGMVFQSYALWPHRTVFKNIAFPLEIQKHPRDDIEARVREVLGAVALEGLAERYPHELSGGQQQRVAVARAIAQKPTVLLMDEPLSNLDAKLREQMRRELKSLQRDLKLTMLYVTHDRLEALELSHRMAILDHGKLIQIGTPQDVTENPANDFVAHFIE
ncbi:MAG: ABC transporter ATP-binding protein [Bdellovibrionota bacterium]